MAGAQEPHLRNASLYLPAPAPFLRCTNFYGHIAGVRSRVDHWHSCFGHCGFILLARWVARIRKTSFKFLLSRKISQGLSRFVVGCGRDVLRG